jgi:crossover junction endodeoxyribonuclease RuvC
MPTARSATLRLVPPTRAATARAGTALVLGFDPGLYRTGYGALRPGAARPQVVDAGVLTTRPADALERRLRVLYREVEALLRELRPGLVVLEDLFAHHAFPRTAIVLGHVRGVICLAAAAAEVGVLALAPSAVKRAVAGTGRASKAQIQAAVRVLLGLRAVGDAHAADALALAYAGLTRVRLNGAGPRRAGTARTGMGPA